jgi:putative Mn2+ efflux pump MntP
MYLHLLSAFLLAIASNVDNLAVAIAYGFKQLRIGLGTNLFVALVSAIGTYLAISVGQEIRDDLLLSVANFLGSLVLVVIGVWCIWETRKRAKQRRQKTPRMREEARRLEETQILVAAGNRDLLSPQPSDPTENFSQEFRQPVNPVSEDFSQEFLQEFSYENFLEHPEKADRDRSGHIDVQEAIALAFGLSLNNLGVGVAAGISDLDAEFTTLLVFAFGVLAMLVGYVVGERFQRKMTGFWAGILSGGLIVITGVCEYFVL